VAFLAFTGVSISVPGVVKSLDFPKLRLTIGDRKTINSDVGRFCRFRREFNLESDEIASMSDSSH
jgi:hypothetical protein